MKRNWILICCGKLVGFLASLLVLSLADNALMTSGWWIILIPGAFLLALLMSLMSIGSYLRKNANRRGSNL